MKNKYAETYQELVNHLTDIHYCVSKAEVMPMIDILNNIEELVDKATPKKVTQFEHEGNLYCWCSKCDHVEMIREIDFMNYCPNCGQKLEWSTDE
jgi:hypothetical protein